MAGIFVVLKLIVEKVGQLFFVLFSDWSMKQQLPRRAFSRLQEVQISFSLVHFFSL
jgi:hypothetical protein